MTTSKKQFPFIVVLALALMTTMAGQTGGAFRLVIFAPEDLKWVANPTQSGPQTAILFGDPAKIGPYIVRVRFPPNMLNPPHSHPDNRLVTILSGTMYLGQGDKPDRAKTTKVVPGTFFAQPAKSVHYDFTGPEEVIIQVSGIGPTSSDFAK